jgi:hypothetical protein
MSTDCSEVLMYAWSSRNRLTPMRMVYPATNWNDHKFDLIKWRRLSLRACRIDVRRFNRVEYNRLNRRNFPQARDGVPWWTRRPKR